MKTYEGKRTIDGLMVTVDGHKLDEHYDVKRFTKYGFEWTYEGESPQQLAFAILYDYLGDKERAIALSEPLRRTKWIVPCVAARTARSASSGFKSSVTTVTGAGFPSGSGCT